MRKVLRVDRFAVIAALMMTGCGSSCSSLGPTPGGFPAAKRSANGAQVRVTPTGLGALTANPAALVGSLLGGMGLSINVPSSCSSSTPVCCPGGIAQSPCGPVTIDLTLHPGDTPRLVLTPASGASRLDVTVRARVATAADIPVKIPLFGECGIQIDTAPGPTPDIELLAPISFPQDATAGTTRISVGAVTVNNLTTDDVKINGGGLCGLANLGTSFFLDTLKTTFTGAIGTAIQDQACKKCPGGTKDECGGFATACTGNVCQEGGQCLQEVGLAGRLIGGDVFSFSPGTTGAIDLYQVAGGYATTDNGGLALGLLGGFEPAGAPRDRCGPLSTEPVAVTVPLSATFQGNLAPDGTPYGLGIGLHQSQLDRFAYAAYDGGLLCLTLGHRTVKQLTTDTVSLIARSLGKLVDFPAPVAVGLRPQRPPTLQLGANTITTVAGTATVTDPLIRLGFQGLELDFYASVDDQYVRVFTLVADVSLPIGLQVGAAGELVPVLGDVKGAFTNLVVKNSEALTESPADLASLFPSILDLVLPSLGSGLGSFKLPAISGLAINVKSITSVDNHTFLAIFADLAPASAPRLVDTSAQLAAIAEPSDEVWAAPRRWADETPPRLTLDLGAAADDDRADLEFAYRIDGGLWSPWGAERHPTVTSRVLWLPGVHHVEVRARLAGRPETVDPTPEVIEVVLGDGARARSQAPGAQDDDGAADDRQVRLAGNAFHGQGSGAGCTCDASGGPGGAAPLALLVALLLLPLRRWLRAAWARLARLGPVVAAAALAALPGCSCGSTPPCGGHACMAGAVAHGAVGRWTSIAADDKRTMVATYDQILGDLVAIDATKPDTLTYVAVDGIPSGVAATYDPSTYRGGVVEPGPDVGASTSIAIASGVARIAYQDRDAKALKYAQEQSPGTWTSHVVDAKPSQLIGAYTSLVVDGDGHPAIAYFATGVDGQGGLKQSELRLARAASATPGATDWGVTTIASAPATCAGLCGAQSCAGPVAPATTETCVAATTDCTPACSDTQVCVAKVCRAKIADPTVSELATGTGLFASLVLLPDGRLAVAYYDQVQTALLLAVETGKGTSTFTPTVLDGSGDRGMWASAAVDGAGVIHLAYQDARGDQLMYTSWNGSAGTPVVVDDGQRMGDRTHSVGAGARIYLRAGTPVIAYQDGTSSDVVLAAKGAPSWTVTPLATGPILDGFHLAVTSGGAAPTLAWQALDPAQAPPSVLVIKPAP